MKKILTGLFAISLMLAASGAIAKEPENIALTKQRLIQYHDSGTYEKDINKTMQNAMQYLKQRVAEKGASKKRLAIILDIDETALSNYSDIHQADFGGTLKEIREAENQGHDPAILPTLALYQYAKANNVAVFFITGRHEDEREVTAKNLKIAGYDNWDGLVFRDGEYIKCPAAIYKSAMRKKLVNEGYDIILNIGDQKSDLAGGYSDRNIKLPNPYYFIA
jgi:predicted secreted acid phosphatase